MNSGSGRPDVVRRKVVYRVYCNILFKSGRMLTYVSDTKEEYLQEGDTVFFNGKGDVVSIRWKK